MSWILLKKAPKNGAWVLAVFQLPGVDAPRGVCTFLRWCKESKRWEDDDGDEWEPGDAVCTPVPAFRSKQKEAS